MDGVIEVPALSAERTGRYMNIGSSTGACILDKSSVKSLNSRPHYSSEDFSPSIPVTHVCDFCTVSFTRSGSPVQFWTENDSLKTFCSHTCKDAFKTSSRKCFGCQGILRNFKDIFVTEDSNGKVNEFCTKKCVSRFSENLKPVVTQLVTGNNAITIQEAFCSRSRECYGCNKTIKQRKVCFEGKGFCSEKCLMIFQNNISNTLNMDCCKNCNTQLKFKSAEKDTQMFHKGIGPFCNFSCFREYNKKNTGNAPYYCCWCYRSKSRSKMINLVNKNYCCSPECLVELQKENSIEGKCKRCGTKQSNMLIQPNSREGFCSENCLNGFQGEAVSKNVVDVTMSGKNAEVKKDFMISNVRSIAEEYSNYHGGTISSKDVAISPLQISKHSMTMINEIAKSKRKLNMKNKALLCKPFQADKATLTVNHENTTSVQTQTERYDTEKQCMVIPVPFPVNSSWPLKKFIEYIPYPIAIPLPIPVPVFFPTTLNNLDDIVNAIEGQEEESFPSDPTETDLLLMAEALSKTVEEQCSREEKQFKTESEKVAAEDEQATSDCRLPEKCAVIKEQVVALDQTLPAQNEELVTVVQMHTATDEQFETENQQKCTTNEEFVDDIEYLDSESLNDTGNLQDTQFNVVEVVLSESVDADGLCEEGSSVDTDSYQIPADSASPLSKIVAPEMKDILISLNLENDIDPPAKRRKLVENVNLPDTHSEYSVSILKQWMMSNEYENMPDTGIFDQLPYGVNALLCKFIKTVRDSHGCSYRPDKLFYILLGIQAYSGKFNREDHIFADVMYSEMQQEFYNYITNWPSFTEIKSWGCTSRTEEKHLWHCNQLGAHTPQSLLFTLVYFFTKSFCLHSVDDHDSLQLLNIARQFIPNLENDSKTTILRYLKPGESPKPLQSSERVLQENKMNPLRCPIRLLEFYLSKCPDTLKYGGGKLFYLEAERCCVPESPIWYSGKKLPKSEIYKMLVRVLLVKDIHMQKKSKKKDK